MERRWEFKEVLFPCFCIFSDIGNEEISSEWGQERFQKRSQNGGKVMDKTNAVDGVGVWLKTYFWLVNEFQVKWARKGWYTPGKTLSSGWARWKIRKHSREFLVWEATSQELLATRWGPRGCLGADCGTSEDSPLQRSSCHWRICPVVGCDVDGKTLIPWVWLRW